MLQFTIYSITHISFVLHKTFLPEFFYVKYYQCIFLAFMVPHCCDSSSLLIVGCNFRHPWWLQCSGLPYIPLPTFPQSFTRPFCHYSFMPSTINVGSMHSCSLIVVTVAVSCNFGHPRWLQCHPVRARGGREDRPRGGEADA